MKVIKQCCYHIDSMCRLSSKYFSVINGFTLLQVPQHIRKGKDVQVDVHRKHITARCKTPSGEWDTLIDDDLPWDINKEQSLWSLEPGKAILVRYRNCCKLFSS